MLNHGSLSYLPEGATLINTSRGAVINENALYDYLLNKKISMAGLDVFEKEPMAADSLLLKLPNTVLTPHIGANTLEAFERSCEFASQKMLQCLKGEIPEEGNPLKEAWFNAK